MLARSAKSYQQSPVSVVDYSNDMEGKKYFDQAMIDEEVFVFHTYPRNEIVEQGGGEG